MLQKLGTPRRPLGYHAVPTYGVNPHLSPLLYRGRSMTVPAETGLRPVVRLTSGNALDLVRPDAFVFLGLFA